MTWTPRCNTPHSAGDWQSRELGLLAAADAMFAQISDTTDAATSRVRRLPRKRL